MKVNASHSIKLPHPDPGIQFGSIGASVSIECEPTQDVCEDREKLRNYVQALLTEAKARTEEHLAQQVASTPEPTRSNGEPGPRSHRRRQFVAPRREVSSNRGNGQSGSLCSPKQTNFIRSLGTQAGFSYDDLGYMAQEAFGKRDLSTLTKKEASAMIKNLLEGDRRAR